MATLVAPGTGGRESSGMGRGDGLPVVVAYLPGWPHRAATLIAALRGRLGVLAGRIEHIGSTAIPGMAAYCSSKAALRNKRPVEVGASTS